MPLGETIVGVLVEAIGYVLVDVLFNGLHRSGAMLRSWVVPGLSYAQALKRSGNFLLGLTAAALFVVLVLQII